MTQGGRLVNQRDVEAAAVVGAGISAFMLYTFQAYTMQFALLAVLYTVVVVRLVHNLGALDVRVLFFAISVVYSTAGSVDYYFFEDSGAYGEVPNATTLLIGSTFMTAAGTLLIARARDSEHAPHPKVSPASIPLFAVSALVLFTAYVGLSISQFGLTIGEFDRATLTSERGAVVALARNLLVACVLVWAWAAGYLRRRFISTALLFVIVAGLVIFDLLYFGDRRVILCMLLGIAYLTLNRSRVLPLLIPLIGASLFGLIVFATLREQPFDLWLDILSQLELGSFLTPVNLDFGGFPLIATDLLESSRLLLSYAPNYLDGLLATIPSVLYPDRPAAFSVWYVQTYHPEVAATGGGKASNWVMESYLNLGVLGPVAAGLATAGLLNLMCSPRSALGRLSCAASIPAFAFVMRYDFTSFLQTFGVITMVAIVLGWQASRCFESVPPRIRGVNSTSAEIMAHQQRSEIQ